MQICIINQNVVQNRTNQFGRGFLPWCKRLTLSGIRPSLPGTWLDSTCGERTHRKVGPKAGRSAYSPRRRKSSARSLPKLCQGNCPEEDPSATQNSSKVRRWHPCLAETNLSTDTLQSTSHATPP